MASPTSPPPQPVRSQADNEEEQRQLRQRMASIGKKVLVLSGKGGVGKSTVAVNLAVGLARAGHSVGLLDVDLHGPSAPLLLGLDGQRLSPDKTGRMVPIQVSDRLRVVSIGLLLDSSEDAVIWRGPLKYNVIRQFLKDVSWGELDYLVIDSPPGTGDEPLSVAQMVGEGASALIVTTPQDVAVADVRRSVSFCRRLGLPISGVVENMSGLVCPHCGERVAVFGAGGADRLAARTGIPVLGRIPLDPAVANDGDQGKPFADSAETPAARAFATVVDALASDVQAAPATAPEAVPSRQTVRIAIPLANGALCTHFGHCEEFALLDADPATNAVAREERATPPEHEPGVLPRWLGEKGVRVILASGMGQRAQDLFNERGIDVVVGISPGDTREIVTAYLGGTLKTGQNVCAH